LCLSIRLIDNWDFQAQFFDFFTFDSTRQNVANTSNTGRIILIIFHLKLLEKMLEN
jgi:hypothetical protein